MSESHNPSRNVELDAEGTAPVEDQPEGLADDPAEGVVPPRDHPVAVFDPDTTAAGQLARDSVAERASQEEPEGGRDYEVVGRLVQPDQGMPGLDTEPDEVAYEVPDDSSVSAEEAAVHITDSP